MLVFLFLFGWKGGRGRCGCPSQDMPYEDVEGEEPPMPGFPVHLWSSPFSWC